VQAHWVDGDEHRSSWSYFVGLEISIDPIDGAPIGGE